MHVGFEGKVAIVTGAASGIGETTARLLAQRGAAVVCADINALALQTVADAVTSSGGAACACVTDVRVLADCRALVASAVQFGGGLDILLNIAGIETASDTVESLSEADWDNVLAVNLKSIFMLSKFAIPVMRERGGGVIVNTASVHAFANMINSAAYAASKGAVVALTRQMANDLARDRIRVVAVAPGSVDTPMSRESMRRAGKSFDEIGLSTDPTVLGRVAKPEEVAEANVWLASDAASFVNGSTLVVDGGLLSKLV